MQKPYLVGFRMNDKEKIKEVLELIDDFMRWHGTEKYKQSDMKYPLKDIVKTLETQKNDQTYQQ